VEPVGSPEVIYDYQVYRRGDKSAFNWKPCDGIGEAGGAGR
jgi:hypothetical protein